MTYRPKIFSILLICSIVFTSCKVVDLGEVGIKFKRFSLTEQGTLKATPASGFAFYNIFTEQVFTYPIYIQRVDYKPFVVTTKDAATFTMDPVLAYQLIRDKAIDVFAKYRDHLKISNLDICELVYMMHIVLPLIDTHQMN